MGGRTADAPRTAEGVGGTDGDGDAEDDDGGSLRISDTTPGDCPVLGVLMCLYRPLDRRV
ncbi:hypothetical protein GCM10010515_13420 [Streptomyces fructofermentans]|uniref:Uncharacterized protein n=1 Tax=Streptomyces fructofermentans TaxID=152141 RepID=A0A918K3R6_9ACTN|nr:hypothetical protein GCM10010515_13420 [Streptomyces fructofermentans]